MTRADIIREIKELGPQWIHRLAEEMVPRISVSQIDANVISVQGSPSEKKRRFLVEEERSET